MARVWDFDESRLWLTLAASRFHFSRVASQRPPCPPTNSDVGLSIVGKQRGRVFSLETSPAGPAAID